MSFHIILHLHHIEDFVLVEATRSLVRLGESGHIISDHKGHKSILVWTNIGYKVHRRSPSTDCIVNSRWSYQIVRIGLYDGYSVFLNGSKMETGASSDVYITENIRVCYQTLEYFPAWGPSDNRTLSDYSLEVVG